jgi:hypothetical protein
MYYQSQPGGFYGAQLGNVEGMEAIAGSLNHDLSYPKIPGRDVQGVPNANDPIMRKKLLQRLLNNPDGKEDLPGFVKKAESQFGDQNPLAFGSSNLPNAVANMGGQFAIGNMGGLANANFENLLAQNQGPSSPVKYYPDANQGKGGYFLNTGAGRIGEVRPRIPLA